MIYSAVNIREAHQIHFSRDRPANISSFHDTPADVNVRIGTIGKFRSCKDRFGKVRLGVR